MVLNRGFSLQDPFLFITVRSLINSDSLNGCRSETQGRGECVFWIEISQAFETVFGDFLLNTVEPIGDS
jgi:hypothetical protein